MLCLLHLELLQSGSETWVFYLTPYLPLSPAFGGISDILWRGVHPEGISLDPEIFGIEGHPEGNGGRGHRTNQTLTQVTS